MADYPYLKETLFISEAGLKLKLTDEAIATALKMYHEFQCALEQEDKYDNYMISMACLNLASKVQEVPSRLSDIVNTCYRCLHPEKPPLEVNELYWRLKESVAKYELVLLRMLKFQYNYDLPHKYLLHHLLSLSHWVNEKDFKNSNLTTFSWTFLQDSFHTNLNIIYPPNVMATTMLYLAVHCCKLHINSEGAHRQWWQVFSPGIEEKELQNISTKLLSFYETTFRKTPFNEET